MTENNKRKFELIDKLIILSMILIFILLVLATIWWVNYKNDKKIQDIIRKYNVIEYSNYKYNINDNEIYFYNNIELKSKYKCNDICNIEPLQNNQFKLDNNDIIIIKDGQEYILYNVINSKIINNLQSYPISLNIINYGKIKSNDKYAIIDLKGNIITEFIFSALASTENYIVGLNNNTIEIYDENYKLINKTKQTINNDNNIFVELNNDLLTIVTISDNTSKSTMYKYNIKTNNYVN